MTSTCTSEPNAKFHLFVRAERLEWQKTYTVVFENGEIWETDTGHDALYICNVSDLMYEAGTQTTARITRHFAHLYGELFGELIGIEQVESIGVWSFIAKHTEIHKEVRVL